MGAQIFAGAGQWRAAADDASAKGLFQLNVETGAWQVLNDGLPRDVEVRFIAIRADRPEIIFAGTQAGPYRSRDGGESWQRLALPADVVGPELVVWSILIHPEQPETMLVGTQDAGVFRSTDGGTSWTRLAVPVPAGAIRMSFPMRVIRMAMDPSNPEEIYVAFEVGGMVRSLDGGASWSSCNESLLELAQMPHLKSMIVSDTETEGMMDSHAVAVSQGHPGEVWLANRMGLFRSADRGGKWAEIDIQRYSELTYARDVQASPHDPDTLYAALSVAAAGDAGSLYRSRDFGETWSRFDHGVSIDSTLMIIAQSRASADRLYCATRRGQVLGTEDGGATWRQYQLPEGVEGVYALACH